MIINVDTSKEFDELSLKDEVSVKVGNKEIFMHVLERIESIGSSGDPVYTVRLGRLAKRG